MNEFVFLYRGGERPTSAEQGQQVLQRWMAWFTQLSSEGHVVDRGQPLERSGKLVGKGKIVTDGPFAELKDVVGGYTLINDISARDWVAPIFSATGTMGPILAWEHNVLGKQFPTFCPLGPVLATKDEIPDPQRVQLTTLVNGEIMQSASTDDLVFGVARVIAHFSQYYCFRPGDVISMGTPAGVGYGRNPKRFLRAGDVVEVRADGVGALLNPIAAA